MVKDQEHPLIPSCMHGTERFVQVALIARIAVVQIFMSRSLLLGVHWGITLKVVVVLELL